MILRAALLPPPPPPLRLQILVIDQAVSIYSGTGHTEHSSSHSHELGGEKDGVLIRLALLVALSVHSLLEGLGVGATTNPYGLLFAIGVHKVCQEDAQGGESF